MENKTIEALEKLVALKDETIKELERQIQLLKNQPGINVPYMPTQPYQPNTGPLYPQTPWQSPYIVTCGDSTTITSFNTPDSVNSNCTQWDPNATYTLTSNGHTEVIDMKNIPHC